MLDRIDQRAMNAPIARAATLALLLAAIAPGAARPAAIDWSKSETVAVVMVEYRFVPEHMAFRLGVPYRLHLDNRGTELHEFTAPDFFAAITVRNRDVLAQGGHEVVLQPHEAKDVYFVANRPGRYSLSCADHDWEGMTGDIVVK